LQRYQARGLIDATHPYAGLMSEQLMGLSKSLGMPYLRYERASSFSADSGQLCSSINDAAEQAIARGRRIFLATGSKDLALFLKAPGAGEREWFVRVTPEPEFIQRAIDLGVPRSRSRRLSMKLYGLIGRLIVWLQKIPAMPVVIRPKSPQRSHSISRYWLSSVQNSATR